MNTKLNGAIDAIGGPVAVAFHLGRTVTWVYKCKAQGGIVATADAVRFQRLAKECGVEIGMGDLVPQMTESSGNGGPKGGKRRSSLGCTPTSDTKAAATTTPLTLAHSAPSALAA